MKKNHKIILTTIVWIIILLTWWKFIYDTYFISPEEKEKIAIDKYNFSQLEKVKVVLKNISEGDMKFRNLQELNKKYNAKIEPIKNCYYTVTTNFFDDYVWESFYIFWFQLESNRYKNKYGEEYYTYPKYDLPYSERCYWMWEWECTKDIHLENFRYVISNPCND